MGSAAAARSTGEACNSRVRSEAAMNELYITEVEIADTMGTKFAKFHPNSVTLVTGVNGSGKSSIIRALTYVFSGGLDPSIIRSGAEKSVISFALSNGVTIKKTTARVKPRKGADPNDPPRYKADVEIV